MTSYVSVKLLRAFVTTFILVTFAFTVLRMSGDPSTAVLGLDVDAAAQERFHERWGLDRPLTEQFADYLRDLAVGDFGRSFVGDRPAISVVLDRLPQTLTLMGAALALALLIGVPLGALAAFRYGTPADRAIIAGATVGYCVPDFVIGILLILLFGATLQILPISGNASLAHYIMPVLALAAPNASLFARITRSAVLDVLSQPHVIAARMRGLPWGATALRHIVPNASIPVITIFGLVLGGLVVGATVTENVFAWPGVGQLLVTSARNRDLAVVQTIVILGGVAMVLANLMVDLFCAWIDPRIRVTSR